MELLFNSASVIHNEKKTQKGPKEEKENMKTEL